MFNAAGRWSGDDPDRCDLEGMWILMQVKPTKSLWLLGVGVLLGASAAYAASDPRYVTATDSVDRAMTFLTGIGTGTEKPGAAFQRKRALKALERAKLRIACAKEIEDSTSKKRGCPAAMKERFDDSDDDKDDHDHGHKEKAEKEKAEKEKAEKELKEKSEKAKAEAKKKAEEKKKAEKK
jgi:hypothetical protein